jgi:diguanylate cyclase with GGDEF domain
MPDAGPPIPPRPRRTPPIAWAAVEPLAASAQAIAKGWLLALLERVPLEAVATIPAADLAAEGPAICAAVARALGSDAELARLRPGGDLAPLAARIGPLAGVRDAAGALGAVESLRACVWAAALDAAGEPREAEAIAALAERLAAVAAAVGATAVAAAAPAPAAVPTPDAPAVQNGSPTEPVGSVRPLPPRPAASAPGRPPTGGMDDEDLWIATLERHIDGCRREGGGLALLRVELLDADRLVATATEAERGVPYGRLAQAIRRAIRRQDLVASDHQGRAWVIAPAVGRAGAIALAERIGAGVEGGEHWRGAPLAATIGFAIYGEDGHDATTLIERADEAMLAASAAGVRIGEALPSDDPPPGPRLVR